MLGSVRTLAYSDHSLKQINAHSSPQLMDCILMHTLEVHHRRHFLLSASFGMVSPLEKKTARTATLTSRRSLNDIKPHAQAVLRPGLVPPAGPESAQMCSSQISGMDSKKKNSPCEPCVRMLYESRCHRSSYAVTPHGGQRRPEKYGSSF